MVCALAVAAGVLVATDQHAESDTKIGGHAPDEALRLGQRMYREGVLPSGEPMRAFVQRDIEVEGTMFSCQSCHLRSGMGSTEGTVVTLPTCGSWVYKPLVGTEMSETSRERIPGLLKRPPFRPAYTDETLGRAIRLGRDPNDRQLNYVMPRYILTTEDTEVLIHYLKNLSATWSPGVDTEVLRFATVITPEVPETDRQAMLATLQALVRDHNSQVRHEDERVRRGPWYKEEKWAPYRDWELDVWLLEGKPGTWSKQLARHYEERPVFALLGGITTGEWEPIHRFSEERELPCFFPITDYPVISETDWYTMYLSKGFYQEGEGAARFLRRADPAVRDAAVLQVVRDDRHGKFLARGFEETRELIRMPAPERVLISPDETVDGGWWRRLAARHPNTVWVLWVDGSDLEGLEQIADTPDRPRLVIVASSRLDDPAAEIHPPLRPYTFIAHAAALPGDKKRTWAAVDRWLTIRELPTDHPDVRANMYFLGWMVIPAVKMMRDDFYRDRLIDIMDMMRDQDYAVAAFPRLSFGPGQRYASKGCYMTQLDDSDPPKLAARSEWVIH
jgi:hypothetical protein